uniref:Uncharacterized protein n=1 Tax=Glossina pallidipes TaxID=7398 RepID=A0A1B0A8L1_GLOPL
MKRNSIVSPNTNRFCWCNILANWLVIAAVGFSVFSLWGDLGKDIRNRKRTGESEKDNSDSAAK